MPNDNAGDASPRSLGRRLTLEAPPSLAEHLVASLEAGESSPAAIAIFDKPGGRVEISAYYPEDAALNEIEPQLAKVAAGMGIGPVRIDLVPDEDWVTLSQGLRPKVRAGRFLVHGSHDRHRLLGFRLAIEIDAGQAFGTAHHPSTRGCLLMLDAVLKRTRPRAVLDLGTGSGILAIAAAKALLRPVLASDSDELAVSTATSNARRNAVAPLMRVVTANGFAHRELRQMKPDLVLANLLERALRQLAPDMARRLTPGGSAILSGLTEDQARGIEARYRALGFRLEKRIVLAGWASLLLSRCNAIALRD